MKKAMKKIEVGSLVKHRLSTLQLFEFNPRNEIPTGTGIVIEVLKDKCIVFWKNGVIEKCETEYLLLV